MTNFSKQVGHGGVGDDPLAKTVYMYDRRAAREIKERSLATIDDHLDCVGMIA